MITKNLLHENLFSSKLKKEENDLDEPEMNKFAMPIVIQPKKDVEKVPRENSFNKKVIELGDKKVSFSNKEIRQIPSEIDKSVNSMDYININRKISDLEIESSPGLILEECEGDLLKNKKLSINAGGYIGGARMKKDGVTYFGIGMKNVK